jgi:RNA polymerase sigma factor (sigma-70 family)
MGVGEGERARDECDGALYEAVSSELTRFACGLVGSSDSADVVASAVAKALASPGWRSVENRRAYLYRAVLNESRKWHRRNALRSRHEARLRGAPTWELPDFRPEVRAAVERLSVRQRAVVLLTYWADLDVGAVAGTLGISDGAVRRHLARGRARLREVLDE